MDQEDTGQQDEPEPRPDEAEDVAEEPKLFGLFGPDIKEAPEEDQSSDKSREEE
jgi:hypothetical protein